MHDVLSALGRGDTCRGVRATACARAAPLRLLVREQRALRVRCPNCEQISLGAFPAAAPSRTHRGPRLRALSVYLVGQQFIPYARVRELLADLLGAHVSVGTMLHWVAQGAAALQPVEEAIKAALIRAPVLHSDETGVRRAGKLAWAHVANTARLAHYVIRIPMIYFAYAKADKHTRGFED